MTSLIMGGKITKGKELIREMMSEWAGGKGWNRWYVIARDSSSFLMSG